MSYVKIWLHFVWATKNRQPLISKTLREKLITHINENAKAKDIYIDTINVDKDHIHLLVSLGSSQTVAQVAHLIKGESSHWVNKQKLINGKFDWQDEYFVVSVSESSVKRVRAYIKNQEEHHRYKSFTEEYNEFLVKYGFKH